MPLGAGMGALCMGIITQIDQKPKECQPEFEEIIFKAWVKAVLRAMVKRVPALPIISGVASALRRA